MRRLADALRESGVDVPADVGTLGPATIEVAKFYMAESYRAHFPGEPMPWDRDDT